MEQCVSISKAKIKWIRSLRLKKNREAEQLFIVEGEKMILEALNSFAHQLELLVALNHSVSDLPPFALNKTVIATAQEMEQCSDFKQPNKYLAVFKIPNKTEITSIRSIVLDGVQDPGNLGTILRLADWYGIDQIICSEDTVDCFNEKVVQASMGAIFRIHVHYTSLISFLQATNQTVYGAFLNGENYKTVEYTENALIVMGNEGKGIRPEIEAFITKKITIPKHGKAESLNVSMATAILLAQVCD